MQLDAVDGIQSLGIAEIHNQGLTSCKPYKETATQVPPSALALVFGYQDS